MDYQYVARTADNRMVHGKVSAQSQEAATDILAYGGFNVLSLKEVVPFIKASSKLNMSLTPEVSTMEVIMFTRQMALLLESGTDAVTSLELLEAQTENKALARILHQVVSDVRAGQPLSEALSRHKRVFSPLYYRLVSVGEKTGTLEVVLRRAADYIERAYVTRKSVKNALTYPVVVILVAIAVIAIMVTYVLPAFVGLYASFEAELPLPTRALLAFTRWSQAYGMYVAIGLAAAVAAVFLYTRTPTGSMQWARLMLTMPRIGRINLLNELSNCCRSLSLLYGSGLPLPEAMTLIVQGTSNKAMRQAYTDLQQAMIAGGGLSEPMKRNRLFLPLMVQMTAVGEQTGNLDHTLTTVAQSYESESDEKTKAMIAMLTPALTIIIGGIVGFIAVSMLSEMYSIFGQAF
ncbi:MAG: type II secretion system F family protein [Dehalococcoidia bacterium]|jgi:type IV pilus assembly protein PilC|nr:type II secretion system F family protein [Dehalococcoidia bacterium]